MNISAQIKQLINYAVRNELIAEEDRLYMTNSLLAALGVGDLQRNLGTFSCMDNPGQLLEEGIVLEGVDVVEAVAFAESESLDLVSCDTVNEPLPPT